MNKIKNSSIDRLHLLLFIVLFGIVGSVVYVITKAAPPPPPTVYVTPETIQHPASTTFTVQIRQNSGTTSINAVQTNLTYPENIIDFVSISHANSPFQTIAESTGGSGRIAIGVGISGTSAPVTGDQLIATVTFRSKTISGTGMLQFASGTALVSSANNTDVLGSLSSTGPASILVDTTPPTLSLTSPTANSSYPRTASSNIILSASASDNTAVSRVDFYVNNTLVFSDSSQPYTHTVSANTLPLGTSSIYAIARDTLGNQTASPTRNISLTDATPPQVSITQPASAATITGSTLVRATASDDAGGSGISKVDFLVDGVLAFTDTTAPYEFTLNSTTLTDGSHGLTARAFDFGSPQNSTLSAAVNIVVDNADRQPPSRPGTPTLGSRTTNSITINWGASTDNVGVAGYNVYRDNVLIATTTGTAFTNSGLNSRTTYVYYVVAFDERNNTSLPSSTLSAATLKIADINADGSINVFDLSILLSNYNKSSTSTEWPNIQVADINRDNIINVYDLSILLSNYGT